MSASPGLPEAVVARLTLDAEPWLSCDDCFEQVDRAVEAALRGGGLTASFCAHLRGCACCREEARSLAALVAPELGLAAAQAVARLDAACGAAP